MPVDLSMVTIRILPVLVITGMGCVTPLAGQPLSFPIGQRQLFLDDENIAQLTNLIRTMHQPEKRGAVVWPNQLWEKSLQTRVVPAWDENEEIFKIWMITSTPVSGVGGVTYAESTDGFHWTKPILNQWEYQGSAENNFINVGSLPLQWPDNAMENIVYDPDDPDPNRRYKGFLSARNRHPIVSPDGIHWTKLSVPEVPSGDESNLSYDRLTGTFIATFKTSDSKGRRAQAIWTSTNFDTWTNTGVVFQADAEDQVRAVQNIAARLADPTLQQPTLNNPDSYGADIYNMGIFRYEGVYVGMPAVFHHTYASGADGFHLVQLTSSRDLRTWRRLGDRQPFIGPSSMIAREDGQGRAYDLTQILPPSAPVVRGDELWFYYTGIKYRATPENPDPDWGAVHLAVLRRDGFISLDADERGGTMRTRPFVVCGTKLFVNVDATEGTLQTTVVGGEGKPLAVSKPVVGDRPRAGIEWKSGDLVSLDGQIVSLLFTLRDAEFYSFWLED